MLLSEKYRPATFDAVVGQEKHIKKLENYIANGYIPHLIFHGPPGTGKTTCARIILTELGIDNPLPLNASVERGIDVIRGIVDSYMSTTSSTAKVVVFEEADQLTRDAQEALRELIEEWEFNCRVIFLCNHVEKINDAIQSRCAIYEFLPLPDEKVKAHIKWICEQEDKEITSKALAAVSEKGRGDLRKTLKILEDLFITGEKITIEDVRDFAPGIEKRVGELLEMMATENHRVVIKSAHRLMREYGVTSRKLLELIHNYILDDDFKATSPDWFVFIADYDRNLSSGGTDLVHVDACLVKMWRTVK